MSTIRNVVMGLMLASTVFAVGCNKAAAEDTASVSPETATATAPVQAQAQTTVTATPTTANATVKASLGTTSYNNYSNAAYQRGVRNGERLEAERIRDREISNRPRPVVIERPVVVERPIDRPVVVNRPVVIERPGFFVRFANWRHNHGCKF